MLDYFIIFGSNCKLVVVMLVAFVLLPDLPPRSRYSIRLQISWKDKCVTLKSSQGSVFPARLLNFSWCQTTLRSIIILGSRKWFSNSRGPFLPGNNHISCWQAQCSDKCTHLYLKASLLALFYAILYKLRLRILES